MFRRLLPLISIVLVLAIVFTASRALIRFLPGDPLSLILSETGTSISREELRRELRLDRAFLPALVEDSAHALRGDLGKSIITRRDVAPLVWERFLNTLWLSTLAALLGFFIAIGLALPAASFPDQGFGKIADHLCTFHGALAAALPTPWIGPILAYLFAVTLPLFPIGNHVALPALTLALAFSGFWARLIRSRVREALRFGSAQGARARGLREMRVAFKYGLIPVSGPLAAYFGTQFGFLLGGAFVTEVIFDWPGIGSLLVHSILARDYPVIEAALFLSASAALLGTALGDFAQGALSPKKPELSHGR